MNDSLRASKVDILGLRTPTTPVGHCVPPKALEGLGQWQSPAGAVKAPKQRSRHWILHYININEEWDGAGKKKEKKHLYQVVGQAEEQLPCKGRGTARRPRGSFRGGGLLHYCCRNGENP